MPLQKPRSNDVGAIRFRTFDFSDSARNNLRLAGLQEEQLRHELTMHADFVVTGTSENLVTHVENLVVVAKRIDASKAEVLFVADEKIHG